jgi:hypothetical protein
MTVRLRTCYSLCGSLSIRKVKGLIIYRCYACNQSFVTPSMKMDKSYSGYPLTRGNAVLIETEK